MPKSKRDSIGAFVLQNLQSAKNTDAEEGSAITRRVGSWSRLAHSANLVGYGLILALLTLLLLAFQASVVWTARDEMGVPVLDPRALRDGIWMPIAVSWTIQSWANIGQGSWNIDGPKYALWSLALGCVGMCPLVYGIFTALIEADVDAKYLGLDMIVILCWVVAYVVVDIAGRSKWAARDADAGASAPAVKERGDKETAGKGDGRRSLAADKRKGKCWLFFQLLPMFGAISIAFAYPFYVIPSFFGGTSSTRLLICLLLHPMLLEATEALGRSTSADVEASKLRSGGTTIEQAEKDIISLSLPGSPVKQLMAYFRRLMLLNMGTPAVTMAAVVVTSIEEALERGFLVEIDSALRSWRGKPPLEGDELRLQRLVWMCDSNQSALTEINAIFVATLAQILLERHAQVFALGYEADGSSLNVAAVFVQLCVELALEIAVDTVAMWSEEEHGVPTTTYFARVKSIKVFFYHVASASVMLCVALFAFVRHPHVFTCDSGYVCDCLEQPQFGDWLADACTNASTTNVTAAFQATRGEDEREALFADVDPFVVTLSFVSGLSILALIALSVLFARYRKRNKALWTIGVQNAALKEELASTKLTARLKARPPSPFTVEEFREEKSAAADGGKELVSLVVAVCSDWVFVSPISDSKWIFFLTFVAPLPLWKGQERFAELQSIAECAQAPLTEQVTRILRGMSCPGTVHGPWLLERLGHVNHKRRVADLAASWVDQNFVAAAHALETDDAKREFEVSAMPAMVRALSNMMLEPFKSELRALSPRVKNEEETEGTPRQSESEGRRASYSRLEVRDSGGDYPMLLRCTREKSVKGAKRMGAKVTQARAQGVPFPAISNLGDALRASFVVQTSEDVRECWRLVSKHFEVIRMKNKFKDAFEELSGGGELRTLSPNLHINCLYTTTNNGVEARIVVEIQIYVAAILEIKRESHKIYDVVRSKTINDLIKTH